MTLGTATILQADARALPLPDASIDLVVTSPPYWSLRSYLDGGEHYAGQIGDEPTPREYVDHLLDCTREWVRVLKPAGSIFVNLGDVYANRATPERVGLSDGLTSRADRPGRRTAAGTGVRPKSLYALPWRYAIACIDELGLILRRDLIWEKTTALPESVTDRAATRHEYVFHFTLAERYYAAVDRIREPSSGYLRAKPKRATPPGQKRRGMDDRCNPLGRLPDSVWSIAGEPLIPPKDLAISHFAAFPTTLPRRIIEGWSPAEVCTTCGEGRQPLVDRGPSRGDFNGHGGADERHGRSHNGPERNRIYAERRRAGVGPRIVGEGCACTPYTDHPGAGARDHTQTRRGGGKTGWHADNGQMSPRVSGWREYDLDAWTPPPALPGIVLDPFGGSGTTALVAKALGRHGISVDRSADYCRLATWRVNDPGQLAKVLGIPKPEQQLDGQMDLFSEGAA